MARSRWAEPSPAALICTGVLIQRMFLKPSDIPLGPDPPTHFLIRLPFPLTLPLPSGQRQVLRPLHSWSGAQPRKGGTDGLLQPSHHRDGQGECPLLKSGPPCTLLLLLKRNLNTTAPGWSPPTASDRQRRMGHAWAVFFFLIFTKLLSTNCTIISFMPLQCLHRQLIFLKCSKDVSGREDYGGC